MHGLIKFVLLAAALSLVGAAHAAGNVRKTGYLSIHPLAFAAEHEGALATRSYDRGVLTGTGCYSAGVNLPDGAIVLRVVVYYEANAERTAFVGFERTDWQIMRGPNFHMAQYDVIPSAFLPVRSGQIALAANRETRTIDNVNHRYGFRYCGAKDVSTFGGARVQYSYTE
jgi:hypothetical protein